MKSHFTWSFKPAAFTATALLFAINGCSFLYDLNTNQCNSTADCLALGNGFSNTVCSLDEHVCVANQDATGGVGGTGPTTNAGSGGTKPHGGSGPNTSAGDGGEAGSNDACTTNADCIAQALDQPAICRQSKTGNECVLLTNDQCPVLIPTTVAGSSPLQLLKTNTPVILGGFASINVSDPYNSLPIINWNMAFEEFNENAAQNSDKTKFQPMLAVVCNGQFPNDGDFAASMVHLTEAIGTPGIISTTSSPNLLAAYNYTQADEYTGGPVMFLSTSSATLQLANLDDNGYVWHLLGDPRVLAATTASLVRYIEPFVASKQTDTSAPLKVALVSNENQTLDDIATVLTNAPPANQAADDPHRFDYLTINGDLAISQTDHFYQKKIKANNQQSAQAAADEILADPPQIIIGLGQQEFASLISEVESGWGKMGPSVGMPRPYYVLSHYLATANDVLTQPLAMYGTSTTTPILANRIVGVNYALAQDPHSKLLYDAWLSRVKRFYGNGGLTLDGTENYYDGAYSMLYAASLTNTKSPDGQDVREALRNRVLNPDGSSLDIGPTAVKDSLPNLIRTPTAKIALWGTDGPPNFDRVSGTRLSATSVWCMAEDKNFTYDYSPDGLLYVPATGAFTVPTSGAPPCLAIYK
ncbi:MAG TPA: hypothetical protein VER96_16360 [Polyangiaceae bacterium]|nr:hypothetical protein [Polyangiaceae bacterium]